MHFVLLFYKNSSENRSIVERISWFAIGVETEIRPIVVFHCKDCS